MIEKINTHAITQFLNTVKGADLGNQKEIRLNITDAKNLAYTLGLVMARLNGNYETLIVDNQNKETVVKVEMDGGGWS